MNPEMPKMPKWQKFQIMGNNCRVRQIPQKDAEQIIEEAAVTQDDFDNFWEGFRNGTEDFVQQVF